MKMAESIVCLRLWHDRFSPRYRKAAPTFRWQPLHIVVPKCKVLCYHTTRPILGLTDKHNASSSKSFDFFQRSNPYCFTRIWDFSCRFALPCVCQDTENDRNKLKKRNENAAGSDKTSDFWATNIRTFHAKHRNIIPKKSDVFEFPTGKTSTIHVKSAFSCHKHPAFNASIFHPSPCPLPAKALHRTSKP